MDMVDEGRAALRSLENAPELAQIEATTPGAPCSKWQREQGDRGILQLIMTRLRFLFDRKKYDALRRRLVAWLFRGVYRPIESSIRRNGELAGMSIRRIVVCRPNHRLGNALLLTPLIQELERSFPEAKIDLVLGGDAGPEVFGTFGNIGRIFSLPRHMAKHPIRVAGLALKLRRARYDLAIDPCDGSQSGRLLLVIAMARHAIGIRSFDSNRDPKSQETPSAPAHMAKLPVFLLRNALSMRGLDAVGDYPPMTINLATTERQTAQATLQALTRNQSHGCPRATVGIFAGATGGKRYAADWWLAFVTDLRAQHADYAMVELGSENGQTQLPAVLPSYFSRNIREVAAFISNMTCFVSADCGVMHLASASGAATLGLFSLTDQAKYAPYGHGSHAINTNGKSPAEVALLVASIVDAISGANSGLPANEGCAHQ